MSNSEYALHLWSMASGQPHATAENPTISCPRKLETNARTEVYSVSVTNSRLALLLGNPNITEGVRMLVWDWRTGELLLVSESLASVIIPDPTEALG
jgi:hypothetical protein